MAESALLTNQRGGLYKSYVAPPWNLQAFKGIMRKTIWEQTREDVLVSLTAVLECFLCKRSFPLQGH